MKPSDLKWRLIAKEDSRLMRVIGAILRPFDGGLFMQRATTYRLPFQKYARVCIPKAVIGYSAVVADIEAHELHHVQQFATKLGPWWVILAQLFPLPVFFSGRWFVERGAYLDEIERGDLTLDTAIDILWTQYGWPWPRSWMRRWFIKKLNA